MKYHTTLRKISEKSLLDKVLCAQVMDALREVVYEETKQLNEVVIAQLVSFKPKFLQASPSYQKKVAGKNVTVKAKPKRIKVVAKMRKPIAMMEIA